MPILALAILKIARLDEKSPLCEARRDANSRAGWVPLAGLTQQRGSGLGHVSPPAGRLYLRLLLYSQCATAVLTAPFRNASRSALIVAASVVGMPCGKPL